MDINGYENGENDGSAPVIQVNRTIFANPEEPGHDPQKTHKIMDAPEDNDDDDIQFIGETVKTATQREKQEDQDLSTVKFHCQFCKETLVGIFNLNTHLRRVHKAKVLLTCNLCGKTFKQNRYLFKHLEEHKNKSSSVFKSRSQSTGKKTTKSRSKSEKSHSSKNKSKETEGGREEINTEKPKRGRKRRHDDRVSEGTKKSQTVSDFRHKSEPEKSLALPPSNLSAVQSSTNVSDYKNVESADFSTAEDSVLENDYCDDNDGFPPSPPSPPSLQDPREDDDWGWDTDLQVSGSNLTTPLKLEPTLPSKPNLLMENFPQPLSPSEPIQVADVNGNLDDDWGGNASPITGNSDSGDGASSVSPFAFPCSKCSLRFRNSRLLKIHQTYHSLKIHVKFRCEITSCFRYFQDVDAYQRHFVCSHVNRRGKGKWKGKRRRLVSKKSQTRRPSIPCKYCLKKSRTMSEALSHQAAHLMKHRRFICEEPGCGLAFNLVSSLLLHKSSDHGKKEQNLQQALEFVLEEPESDWEPEEDPFKSIGPLPETEQGDVKVKVGENVEESQRSSVVDLADSGNKPEPSVRPVERITLNGKILRTRLVPTKSLYLETDSNNSHRRPRVPKTTTYSCPICQKCCKTLGELDLHGISHSEVEVGTESESNVLPVTVTCSKCPKSFAAYRSLQRHLKSTHATTKESFPCPQCPNKSFTTRHDLSNHLRYHRMSPDHKCPECGRRFKLRSHLNIHVRRHSQVRPFACTRPNCSQSFPLASELRRHERAHAHKEKRIPRKNAKQNPSEAPKKRRRREPTPPIVRHDCVHCGKNFQSARSLLDHFKVVHSGESASGDGKKLLVAKDKESGTPAKREPFMCDLCGACYTTLVGCARHKMMHEENTDILCDVCGRDFKTQEDLSMHKKERHKKKTSNKEKAQKEPHICDICGKCLSTPSGLRTHMERHDGTSLICDECGKACITKGDLKFHKLTHLTQKPFQCEFCPFRYNHPSNIYNHMQRDHTGPEGWGFVESEMAADLERLYGCDMEDCTESYTSMAGLKQHQLYHKGVKSVPCKKCDEKFISKYDAYVHCMLVHRRAEFDCKDCGKFFTGKMSLESHRRYNHTLEEPFACKQCDRKFKSKGDLSYHMVAAHTGDYRFCCEICGKKVVTKGNLNAHMRVHTGARIYKCEEGGGCEAAFKASTLLKKHLLKVHGKKDTQGSVIRKRRKGALGWNIHCAGRPAKIHLLTRTNLPDPNCRIPCQVCGKKFSSAEDLRKHSGEAHAEVEPPRNIMPGKFSDQCSDLGDVAGVLPGYSGTLSQTEMGETVGEALFSNNW